MYTISQQDDLRNAVSDPSFADPPAETNIAVVIPFFQRQHGVLAVALQSIVDQVVAPDVRIHVIVVDDASPAGPDEDIGRIETPTHITITVVRRANGGAGAARNSGLDHVAAGTALVALLDSDDAWRPTHLQEACDALKGECDLYFCDHRRPHTKESHLSIITREFTGQSPGRQIEQGASLRFLFEAEPFISAQRFHYPAKAALRALSRAYIAHTSTLVLRHHRLGAIRFDEDLRAAGEDYLYMFRLAGAARQVCYSPSINVERGVGVSIYESAMSWNHPSNVFILLDNARCTLRAGTILENQGLFDDLYRLRVREREMIFLYAWIRLLITRRRTELKLIALALKEDAWLLARAPAMMMKFLTRKMMRRPAVGPGY